MKLARVEPGKRKYRVLNSGLEVLGSEGCLRNALPPCQGHVVPANVCNLREAADGWTFARSGN